MKLKRVLIVLTFVIVIIVLVGLQFSDSTSTPSASAVDWKSFDVANQLSQQQGKRILVDVYTNWCSWCKKMDKEVYTDPTVSAVIQSQFIAVKLSAEAGTLLTYQGKQLTEAQFAKALGISGYPTTVFFEADGKPITVVPGFIPADNFANILRFIGEGHYHSTSFETFLANRRKAN